MLGRLDLAGILRGFLSDPAASRPAARALAGTLPKVLASLEDGRARRLLARLLPREDVYRHRHGSRGHGGDHVMPAFVSASMTVPVREGRMLLGTWQSVVLVDPNVDNPQREVLLSFLPG